jgi:hypothetical protein
MNYSPEYVEKMEERWREAYKDMLEKLYGEIHELEKVKGHLIREKTRVERQHDLMLNDVKTLFGEHHLFSELVELGWFDEEPHDLDQ